MNRCLRCGIGTANPKFCSSSCAASHNNSIRSSARKSTVLAHCLNCSEPCLGRRAKFCSVQCNAQYKSKKVIDAWLADPTTANKSYGLPKSIRSYMIKRAGYRCEKCGWGEINPTTGRSPLDVDHIDGDHQNNYIGNLRVLCPNCHSLTETYKALNKGRGRLSRRIP